ncbi:MMPL family transporter [Nocardioides sp. TRM66260-LWL]|uniref:MMPL family transporter n=1 Tax=Nocardioides sp. TRM66260-LWL TaxID=2874478 RepID=UPI001CC5D6F2|nr:MMPL family transporter [Nocardioides sp. TRM66260-LWL]MBZ5736379.1 MMPL family transporter [Nocardioides sp. TRM66260-LWL]
MERWGRIVAGRPRRVLGVGLLLTVLAAAFGAGVFGSLSQGGFDDAGSQSAAQLRETRALFGNRTVDVQVLYSSDTLRADDAGFRDAVEQVVRRLPQDAVTTVVPYWRAPSLVSADGRHALVLVSLAGSTEADLLASYDRIRTDLVATAPGVSTDVAGAYAVYTDVNRRTSEDLARAELISLPLVVLLALLIFRSAVAALMPALVGLVALLGALAVVRLITLVTDVSVFSVNVISLLGIGLAIDYALFVVSRFREELAGHRAAGRGTGPDVVDAALRRTLATAGRTVLFSGLTVAAAMASLLIFPQGFLRSMGFGGMAAVLVAVLAALTVLPAVLRLLGPRIDAGRLPGRLGRRRSADGAEEGERWERLARGVMRRPVLVVAATAVVLLAVASPFLGVRWGSVDHRVLPADEPSALAAERIIEVFGDETSTADVLVRGDARAVAAYRAGAQDVPSVVSVAPVAERADATLLRVTWTGNSQTEASQDVVRALRAVPADGAPVLVGGLAASTVDLIASVGAHLPWMALIVAVVMLVLLFLAFGSLVLPVKAIAMNLVSIGASFGVVTWIFSDGHGAGLLGFTSQGFLDATNPILMLAILFGLSMDYEVFLLSRVREEWDRTGDNVQAVALGVRRTGRIITSAALLLGVVIGAFSTSGIVFMKMLGLGMLVALLIDATVVRALLVPATMRLLGRWNWWAPGPLARWWERHGFHEEPPAPGAPVPTGAGPDARVPVS